MKVTRKAEFLFRSRISTFVRHSSLLLMIVGTAGCETRDRVEVGAAAPGYGAVDLAGDSVDLAGLQDRVVLLNVWATWCGPCRDEIPVLQALQERNGIRGLEVVGVSVDGRGDRSLIQPFADSFGVTYRLWHDPEDLVRSRFQVVGVPASFLIDRKGILVWRHAGPITLDNAEMNAAIEAALDEES